MALSVLFGALVASTLVAMALSVLFGALVASTLVYGTPLANRKCEVRARTAAGWVCGARRYDVNGAAFASFTNVPYAQQPLGKLRFKELQPPKPWDYLYDATKLGPICPQQNLLYGPLMYNSKMSEACIHANIYVPLDVLPTSKQQRPCRPDTKKGSLPILVFIHGGGFVSGSGDPDLHGPEYLVAEDIIVITFNYRLNVFGFLSLNTPNIPGNNGLRDAVTFLRWVQHNAHYFGGNPNDVTIAGQSTGSTNAHLMVLSRAAEGLFQRAILMSGVASRVYYTASPKHAKEIANSLLSKLNITADDPDEIHRQLVEMPLEKLINATVKVHIENSPISFSPVIEEYFPGITTILDADPECLILDGQGNNIPILVGFTSLEGEFFINNFKQSKIVELVKKNPLLAIPPDLVYKLSEKTALTFGKMTADRYFGDSPSAQKFSKCYADYAFVYPGIKLMQQRTMTECAPIYLYQFAYNASFSPIKYTKNINYNGATHCEDLTTIFKTNSLKGVPAFDNRTQNDIKIRQFMVKVVKNFIIYNAPNPEISGKNGGEWPAQSSRSAVKYENILKPDIIFYTDLNKDQSDMVHYFDRLYEYAVNQCSSNSDVLII